MLAAGTRPSQVVLQRGLLQQPPDLGLASSLNHLDAPDLTRWHLGREESLSLSHCVELGCRAKGACPFPTVPQAPIDGRIAGELEAVFPCPGGRCAGAESQRGHG